MPPSAMDPVCITYGTGPIPLRITFPPQYCLANLRSAAAFTKAITTRLVAVRAATGPTNAGFVPYSAEVMYEERGFGYYSCQ